MKRNLCLINRHLSCRSFFSDIKVSLKDRFTIGGQTVDVKFGSGYIVRDAVGGIVWCGESVS